jgi:hypothetical protein
MMDKVPKPSNSEDLLDTHTDDYILQIIITQTSGLSHGLQCVAW